MADPKTKVEVEMSPDIQAKFDALTAKLDAAEQRALKAEQTAKATLLAEREKAARAEVEAFVATVTAGPEIRFGKEAVEKFKLAYTDAKIACLSDEKGVAELAAKFVSHLGAIVKAQGAIVPVGEKNPAEPKDDATAPTKEDFAKIGTDREVDAKIHSAVMAFIQSSDKPVVYEAALNTLAKKVGVDLARVAPGLTIAGATADDDE